MTWRDVTVHLALDDPSGDSAIIEYLDGEPRIHHDRDNAVVTNSPPYEQQLEHLKRFQGLGGDEPLPGTTEPSDRFVRAAYYVKQLPEPRSRREAVAELLSVMRNVAQPFGTRRPGATERLRHDLAHPGGVAVQPEHRLGRPGGSTSSSQARLA